MVAAKPRGRRGRGDGRPPLACAAATTNGSRRRHTLTPHGSATAAPQRRGGAERAGWGRRGRRREGTVAGRESPTPRPRWPRKRDRRQRGAAATVGPATATAYRAHCRGGVWQRAGLAGSWTRQEGGDGLCACRQWEAGHSVNGNCQHNSTPTVHSCTIVTDRLAHAGAADSTRGGWCLTVYSLRGGPSRALVLSGRASGTVASPPHGCRLPTTRNPTHRPRARGRRLNISEINGKEPGEP